VGHSIASDLDDCARNMKLSKIHELHLHFACHAPFVANVTIAATQSQSQLQSQSQSQLQSQLHLTPPFTNSLDISYFTLSLQLLTRQKSLSHAKADCHFNLQLATCNWQPATCNWQLATASGSDSGERETGL